MAKCEVNGKYTSDIYKYLKRNSILFDTNLSNAKPIRQDFCKVFYY